MVSIIEGMTGFSIKSNYFDNSPTLNLFADHNRVALLYGKNGSGKTTIAQGFHDYIEKPTFPKVELTPMNGKTKIQPIAGSKPAKIFIFDEKYVQKKVKVKKDGLDAIVLFGAQIDLTEQIENIEGLLKTKTIAVEQQQTVFNQFKNTGDCSSPEYWIAAISDKLKETGAWADRDSKIKDNTIKSSVTHPVIDRLGQLHPDKTREQLQKLFDDAYRVFTTADATSTSIDVEIKQIQIVDKADEKAKQLLSRIVVKPHWTEREQKIFEILGGNTGATRAYLADKKNIICPKCLQPIDEEYRATILKELDSLLNNELEEFTAELEEILAPDVTDYQIYSELPSYKTMNIYLKKYIKAIASIRCCRRKAIRSTA